MKSEGDEENEKRNGERNHCGCRERERERELYLVKIKIYLYLQKDKLFYYSSRKQVNKNLGYEILESI